MILTFISNDEKELKERMILRQVGWNHILVKRLRKKVISETELQFFDISEQNKIKNAVNANQIILKLQSEDLKKVLFPNKVDIIHHIEIEKVLTNLEASLGKTEPIKNTKFSVLYDLLIVISIYVFSGLLALAIVDSAHFF
ncbi:MAG: hypothetical protein HWD82_01935 [Flavobacteriaceae bacterium]|nr:hypothetical protein [Flavobacteriaceae bacterium]